MEINNTQNGGGGLQTHATSQLLEKPSFDIDQVQLQFDLKHGLKKLLVLANKMFIISSASIIKIDLDNPSQICKINLPTNSNSIHAEITNYWLHPNGYHLIIQLNSNTYYYLNDGYTSLKPLPKFKNLSISNVLFFESIDEITTGNFLISTTDGNILISCLKSHSIDNKRDDKVIKLLFKSPSKSNIWGLSFDENLNQFSAFTENCQYIWNCFDTSYLEIIKVFKSAYKMLTLTQDPNNIFISNKSIYFCLSSSYQIYSNDPEIELANTESLPIDGNQIFDMAMSEHHLLGLDKQNLLIFNKLALNASPVNIDLTQYGESFIGVTADNSSGTYWLYSDNSIFELVIQNESISVWYNYFKMGKYEEALKCLNYRDYSNTFRIDMVLIKQGYDLLQRGGFGVDFSESEDSTDHLLNLQIQGIQTLAKLTEPFEKICLMLLTHTSSTSSSLTLASEKLLLEYILIKYHIARDIDKNKIRIQVLSSWIVELLLRIIHRLENDLIVVSNERTANTLKTEIVEFNDKFRDFLQKNCKYLHHQTIYQIISDLYFTSKLLYYADLIEDWEFIVNYHIDNSQWKEALQIILKIYLTENQSNNIIYQTSNVLLTNYPKGTIETWLKFDSDVDNESKDEITYEKFLPAILTYNKNNNSIPINENHSIHFLTQLIFDKGIRNKQINNYYLSLLITYPDTSNNVPSALTNFELAAKQINKFLNFAQAESSKIQLYDSQFILRLCLSHKHFQAAVVILIQDLNLFEHALELALNHGFFDLGEFILRKYDEIINNSEGKSYLDEFENKNEDISKISLQDENFSRRKKLWITFSKYLINNVCSGKPSNIINKFEIKESNEINEVSKQSPKNGKVNNGGISDITKEIVGSITSNEEPISEVNLTRLNQVLKYILNLANSENKQDFIGLKDLLPLFPENIVINDFKDEIVKSLNQYNSKINQLSLEMKESLAISSDLKQQIKDMTNNQNQGEVYSIIQAGEPCLICGNLLISKNLILFPNCHHGFHKDCLIRNYLKLNNYRFKKIFNNFKLNPSDINKNELDENLTQECWLCNQLNINQIDSNLIDPLLDKEQISEWNL